VESHTPLSLVDDEGGRNPDMNVNSEHRHDFYAQYDKIVTDLATDVAAGTFATESIPEIV